MPGRRRADPPRAPPTARSQSRLCCRVGWGTPHPTPTCRWEGTPWVPCAGAGPSAGRVGPSGATSSASLAVATPRHPDGGAGSLGDTAASSEHGAWMHRRDENFACHPRDRIKSQMTKCLCKALRKDHARSRHSLRDWKTALTTRRSRASVARAKKSTPQRMVEKKNTQSTVTVLRYPPCSHHMHPLARIGRPCRPPIRLAPRPGGALGTPSPTTAIRERHRRRATTALRGGPPAPLAAPRPPAPGGAPRRPRVPRVPVAWGRPSRQDGGRGGAGSAARPRTRGGTGGQKGGTSAPPPRPCAPPSSRPVAVSLDGGGGGGGVGCGPAGSTPPPCSSSGCRHGRLPVEASASLTSASRAGRTALSS